MSQRQILRVFSFCLFIFLTIQLNAQQRDSLVRKKIRIRSSLDQSLQPSYIYLPGKPLTGKKVPLVVFLHTWSTDLEQRFSELEKEVADRGWILLEPNFRGRNDHPQACGSFLAQHDVLDAVTWTKGNFPIDDNRIYLTGFSGGGYLTMLMVMLYPKNFTAASAWCGISDLVLWYDYDFDKDGYYASLMRKCFGGSPHARKTIADEYRKRSPVAYFTRPIQVPLDIAAGRYDTIVPPLQSVNAFNALAKAAGFSALNGDKIRMVVDSNSPVADQSEDTVLKKTVYLKKQEGNCRITIFDGGHEWIPAGALQWFDLH